MQKKKLILLVILEVNFCDYRMFIYVYKFPLWSYGFIY